MKMLSRYLKGDVSMFCGRVVAALGCCLAKAQKRERVVGHGE